MRNTDQVDLRWQFKLWMAPVPICEDAKLTRFRKLLNSSLEIRKISGTAFRMARYGLRYLGHRFGICIEYVRNVYPVKSSQENYIISKTETQTLYNIKQL